MGRTPCCAKVGVNRGAWCVQEDQILTSYINANGEGNWKSLPLKAGLNRCGKSCRLRWINYLKPGIKRGGFTEDEDDLLIKLHNLLGNRWSLIAGRLPGRTDNEIKNYWNTTLSKKVKNNNSLVEKGGHHPSQNHLNSNIESGSRSRSSDHKQKLQHSTNNDHSQNGANHFVHYTKAYRCTKVVLPPRLETSTSPLLLSSDEAGEHQLSDDMMLDVNDRYAVMKIEDIVGISCPSTTGEDGGSGSPMFSFSPTGVEDCDLLLSQDFEAMPNWSALQKMASFLDLEVDEWK